MWRVRLVMVPLLGALGPGLAAGGEMDSLVDLTHPFDATTIYWPTESEGFVLERGPSGRTEAGYWYEAHRFRSAEHGGTHVDAPVHFAEGRPTVDRIPLERLIAPGIVVDVSAKCARDRDYLVSREDFRSWESRHGPIPEGSIVLLRTGFGLFWPDRERYLGTDQLGEAAVSKLHFPGLHAEAAAWLAGKRRIAGVGIDTASIDHGPSTSFAAHVALFEREIPAFENVANLDRLPAKGFTVYALPMKIAGGSGAPLRIVAHRDAAE